MHPGIPFEELGERMYEMAKGAISFGGFDMIWDFTEGLTKEQWVRRKEIQDGTALLITKEGRIIMPAQNIY